MGHPVFFDEVKLGEEIPMLHKGPLTTAHLMRWSSAIENWHKIHYDRPFAIEHDKLPDLLVNGSFKQQFIMQLLKDWVGPTGWVWKVNFQFRAMNVVGESLDIWGRVVELRRTADYGLVDVELGIRNAEGKESTPGTAIVVLPYRGGPTVPYPFLAPSL